MGAEKELTQQTAADCSTQIHLGGLERLKNDLIRPGIYQLQNQIREVSVMLGQDQQATQVI